MKHANCDKRYPHYLSRLESREGPEQILIVDCTGTLQKERGKHVDLIEALDEWTVLPLYRSNSLLNCRNAITFRGVPAFWEQLENHVKHAVSAWVISYQCTRVWSLLGLWRQLERGIVRISGGDSRAVADPERYGEDTHSGLLIAEDPPCIAQLRIGHHQGRLLWLDIRNWGIDLPDDCLRGRMACDRMAWLVQQIDYIIRQYSLGSLCPTAAGQSYRSWRTAKLDIQPHCHVNPVATQLEIDGHVGGRCECFYLGECKEPIYHLDIRSCYGSVMAQNPLPVRLANTTKSPNATMWRDAGRALHMLAKVRINTTEPAYPVRRDHDTIYPVGVFTTTLAGPEFSDAIRHNRVVDVYDVASYETAGTLNDFAKTVYRVRDTAELSGYDLIADWAKYVLNGVVGKAAQKRKSWETVPGARAPELWGEWSHLLPSGKLERWRSLAGVVQREIDGGYCPDAVPAIAAWICSYGRMRLLELIRIAGRENVVYVDTDCLLCNRRGYEYLVEANQVADRILGLLELRDVYGECEIRGIKYYREGDTVKCAGLCRGIRVRSDCGLGEWTIPPAAYGAKIGREQGYRRRLIKWPRPGKYRHGVVRPDGRVDPHTLTER